MGNGTPGCDDSSCCAAVCSVDSFCCDTTWDAQCVTQAAMFRTCGMPGGGDVDLVDLSALTRVFGN